MDIILQEFHILIINASKLGMLYFVRFKIPLQFNCKITVLFRAQIKSNVIRG